MLKKELDLVKLFYIGFFNNVIGTSFSFKKNFSNVFTYNS
ncbi:hypothetical protein llh_0680 [Lactococcus cremoris subsp. cremoris A76]|nr:hypothetical protein llh_0680 [Lactococcus cremoris subsp. cremoris A76]